MSKELSDDDPNKWRYTEHARAKHAIQRTYLGAWLPILGGRNDLALFDGFAGRGRYIDGEPGSPLVFWERAVEAVDNGRATKVGIRCVELNENNFSNLKVEIADLRHGSVRIDAVNAAFADEAIRAAGSIAARKRPPATFWTADPYGFKGVPLDVIRRLMQIPRAEVLITFMVRDMRRFLEQPNFQAPLDEFFGGSAWTACLGHTNAEDREQCLLLTYSKLIRDGIARFATPFRVFEDDRRQTLYYLVHLSNHPLGMREMKKAMIRESPDMTFWPVTVRPPDQLALDVGEQAPWARLQEHLAETYGGRTVGFEDLLNEDYPKGLWLEPQYREAILAMEASGAATVKRDRTTPTKRAPRGLKLEDEVAFGLPQLRLS